MKQKIYAVYVGNGAHVPGVPARDLTRSEYMQHRERIESCPTVLYEVRGDSEKEKGVNDAAS